ncbi:hypothetical protein ACIQPP_10110 [Streptomyces violaceusniger]|uniref:hypothetical protein n=1 Tax=Streptomyces violaceusniger TaxID=68280 RepID=UPI0009C289EF|nr:hypothetical protein [Streptomyces hygroscopicus]AQW46996.1 arylsulfatase [Streptomyces hygroscopicus]
MTNSSPRPPSASGTFQGEIGTTYEESTPWWPEQPTPPEDTPNVVVIVLDDVGFSDLGCFGSDIETPAMMEQTTASGPYTQWPLSRGFERCYGIPGSRDGQFLSGAVLRQPRRGSAEEPGRGLSPQ